MSRPAVTKVPAGRLDFVRAGHPPSALTRQCLTGTSAIGRMRLPSRLPADQGPPVMGPEALAVGRRWVKRGSLARRR